MSAKPRFQQFLRYRRMVRDLETTLSATLSWIWRTGVFQDQMAVAIPEIVECLKNSDSSVREAAILAVSEISKNGMRDLETTFSATLSWIRHTGAYQDQMGLVFPKMVECLKDRDSSVCGAAISAVSEISKNGTWSRDYALCHVALNMAYRCISRSNGSGYP